MTSTPHAFRAATPDGASAEAAFDALFRAHFAELAAFVYRLVRSRAVAEELVQDLFLAVWEQQSRLAVGAVTRSYLFTGARNRAVSYLRRERVRLAWSDRAQRDETPAGAGAVPATEHAVETAEVAAVIAHALSALPDRCRLVFTLNRQHGMSYAEVADALGITVKAVEANMGRALTRLRAAVDAYLLVPLLALLLR